MPHVVPAQFLGNLHRGLGPGGRAARGAHQGGLGHEGDGEAREKPGVGQEATQGRNDEANKGDYDAQSRSDQGFEVPSVAVGVLAVSVVEACEVVVVAADEVEVGDHDPGDRVEGAARTTYFELVK